MRLANNHYRQGAGGFALALTMVIISVGMMTLAGVLLYCHVSGVWVQRSNAASEARAAAEAASEVVVAQMQQDFRSGGTNTVTANLDYYRTLAPPVVQSGIWDNFGFVDGAWTANRLTITTGAPDVDLSDRSLTNLPAPTYWIDSYVQRAMPGVTNVVTVGVRQMVTLVEVPLPEFACYYNLDLELYPWENWTTDARVHSNAKCFFQPTGGSTLRFTEEVSAAGGIVHGDNPEAPQGGGSGTIIYDKRRTSGAGAFTMSIDMYTNNAHVLIEVPPIGESPSSVVGSSRFYNNVDLIVRVLPGEVVVWTSVADGNRPITTNLTSFIRPNVTNLWDQREQKEVRLTELDLGELRAKWIDLNARVPNPLGVQSIFVVDQRPLPNSDTINGVKIRNASLLPDHGLVIASPHPIYLLGNFNTATNAIVPAIVAGDAITLLSAKWNETNINYWNSLSSRAVNQNSSYFFSAITGIVPSSAGDYSGGAYNAVRLMEDWTARDVGFRGALCVLFESKTATNSWEGMHGVSYRKPHSRVFRFGYQYSNSPYQLPASVVPNAYSVPRTGFQLLGPPS